MGSLCKGQMEEGVSMPGTMGSLCNRVRPALHTTRKFTLKLVHGNFDPSLRVHYRDSGVCIRCNWLSKEGLGRVGYMTHQFCYGIISLLFGHNQ